MQQPASGARSHATDFASRDTECSNFAPGQLNPNAPAFHPNQPNFWTQQKSGLYGKQALLLGKERLQRHTSLFGSFAQEMAFDVVSLPEEPRFLMTSPSGGIDSSFLGETTWSKGHQSRYMSFSLNCRTWKLESNRTSSSPSFSRTTNLACFFDSGRRG